MCTLSGVLLFASSILIEPRAHWGMKLAWARVQTGCDCLSWYGQVWNKWKCFYLSECVCVCVNQRHQRKQMQSSSVIDFLIKAWSRLLRLHFIAVLGKPIWGFYCKKKKKSVMLYNKSNVRNCAVWFIVCEIMESAWNQALFPLFQSAQVGLSFSRLSRNGTLFFVCTYVQ